MAKNEDRFSFDISLSVLNHLGRNLYRSFMTVLGEAISNSWDADASNVWIYIDKANNSLIIKDDGDGMDKEDFQGKFLKIGYSKRKSGVTTTSKGRPFIGRKGIGKLALLSCADRIGILSKTIDSDYIGGIIDNSGLDQAITDDLSPQQYQLGEVDHAPFEKYMKHHEKGTIIYFENLHDLIKNRADYLKKLLALYFRFSLLDGSFNIFLEDEEITYDDLNDFASKTQFVWNINELNDPYVTDVLANMDNVYKKKIIPLKTEINIQGFIASVQKPSFLKIATTDEKVSVDLFVNGRLREKDILKHIASTRVVESYLYGQIHFDELDDEKDRFASSREGVVAGDEKYEFMLDNLKNIVADIMDQWDKLRIEVRQEGDPDNPRFSEKERKARELFNIVSGEYTLPKDSPNKARIDCWVDELADDAQFNFSSYAECFISENLMRRYIRENGNQLSTASQDVITKLRNRESENKAAANINIDLRQNDDDLSYLDMALLAKTVDPQRGTTNTLDNDAKEYKPIRDALAHTALLTQLAKDKLTTVYENMKARVRSLLSTP